MNYSLGKAPWFSNLVPEESYYCLVNRQQLDFQYVVRHVKPVFRPMEQH